MNKLKGFVIIIALLLSSCNSNVIDENENISIDNKEQVVQNNEQNKELNDDIVEVDVIQTQDDLEYENRKIEYNYETDSQSEKIYKAEDSKNIKFSGITSEKSYEGKKSYKIEFDDDNLGVKRSYHSIDLIKKNISYKGKVLIEGMIWADYNSSKLKDDFLTLLTLSSYSLENYVNYTSIRVDENDEIVLRDLFDINDIEKDKESIVFKSDVKIPKKEWFKLSVLVDYTKENKYKETNLTVKINDEIASIGLFSPKIVNPVNYSTTIAGEKCGIDKEEFETISVLEFEKKCDMKSLGRLDKLHFGIYGGKYLDKGVIYNDNITIEEFLNDEDIIIKEFLDIK